MSDDQDQMAAEWAAAMEEQEQIDTGGAESNARPASFAELKSESKFKPIEGAPDLDVILDIPVRISMEVGSTEISIRNLLQLNQGSVIELDRLAGEPLDVLVNGTLIAHGEVVVVNEKFGIRMTDVISPSERIKKLR
jgi:flagellar motor switch protein FliN/FliY